jgi:hypothetical protein
MRAIISKMVAGSLALAISAEMAFAQVDKPISATGPTFSGFMANVSNWLSTHRGAAVAIFLAALCLIGFTIYNRKRPNG